MYVISIYVLLVYLYVWQRVDIQETTQPFLMELVQEAIMLWRESKSRGRCTNYLRVEEKAIEGKTIRPSISSSC